MFRPLRTTNMSGSLGAETAGGAMGCLSCGFTRHSQALEVQVRCVVVLLHPKNNRQSKQTIQGGDTKERKSHIYYIIYIYRYAKWFEAIRQIGELDR